MKIGLTGATGTGRTTVAFQVANELEIEFLPSRSITQKILERDGYEYSSGIQVEKFLASEKREIELINKRVLLEDKTSEPFIVDRTTLDNFAYLLLEIDQYCDEEIEQMAEICKKNMQTYTHLFYFPYKNQEIKDDSRRTLNKWFHVTFDLLLRGLIESWGIEVVTVNSCQYEDVLKHLK